MGIIKTSTSKINLKAYGAIGDGTVHTVNDWLVGEPFDRGYANLAAIQVDYPTVDSLAYNADLAAWERAKADVPAEGGDVFIPNGEYMLEMQVFRNNIRIVGESREGVLINSTTGGDNGIQISGYRRVGWELGENDVKPYEDTVNVGQGWIEPKDMYDLDFFDVGDVIFINTGSSIQFDQEAGEFNRVKSKSSTRLYLDYNLQNDYNVDVSPFGGTVLTAFTAPALNSNVFANIEYESSTFPNNGSLISVGNDLYEVVGVTVISGNETTTELKCVKGTNDVGATIPVDTKVFKQRVIIKCPETYGNVVIENLSVRAQGDTINLSNSVGVELNNVNLYRGDAGGLWMDGDDGRDGKFRNCRIECDQLRSAQPARSYAEMSFRDCEFFQSTIHFSEFCKNCEVIGCKFYVHNDEHLYVDPLDAITDSAPVGLGWTTSNITVRDNTFFADGIITAIDTFPDINGFRAAWRGGNTIKDNLIFGDDLQYFIRANQTGAMEISGNKIFGSAKAIFAVSGYEMPVEGEYLPLDGTIEIDGEFILTSYLYVHNNYFAGKCAILNFGRVKSIRMEDNYFHMIDNIVDNWAGQGNIIWRSNDDPGPNIDLVIIKNNVFKNWLYQAAPDMNQSFRYDNVFNDRVEIRRNLFLNARDYDDGTYLETPEFFVDFSPNITEYLTDAPEDGTTYGRNDGEWVATGGGGGSAEWGDITGTLADQTDLQNALNAKVDNSDFTILENEVDGLSTDLVQAETDIEDIQADYVKSTADFDTAGRVVIVDSAGRVVQQGSKLLADLRTEADVVDTARQYTKGQGTAPVALSITGGNVTPDLAAANAFTLDVSADYELQLPTNDRTTSWHIRCTVTGAGGYTTTTVAGYVADGGGTVTLPTVSDDKYTLFCQSYGDGTHSIAIHTDQS